MSVKTIISTVGTSVFDKFDKSNLNEKTQESLDLSINLEKFKNGEFNKDIEEICKNLNEEVSAEVQSIEAIRKKENLNGNFNLIFIASDTVESYLIAKSLECFYKKKNINVCVRFIKDLKVDKLENFNKGIISLFKELRELILNIKNSQEKKCKFKEKINRNNFIFNITGGYKATVPFITLFATLYNLNIYYKFEDSNELIEIKLPPISFDDKIADLYLPFLDKNGLKLLKNDEFRSIKNKLIELGFINNEKEKTPIGELFFDLMQHKKSNLGFIMEYIMLEKFIRAGYKFIDKNVKYNVDDYKENEDKKGEIDLIFEKDNNIYFVEVKAFGSIDKSQLEKHMEKYIEKYNTEKTKILKLAIYLIDEKLLNNKKDLFKQIGEYAKTKKIEFEVSYIKIEPSPDFIKNLEQKNLSNFNYFIEFIQSLELKDFNNFNYWED